MGNLGIPERNPRPVCSWKFWGLGLGVCGSVSRVWGLGAWCAGFGESGFQDGVLDPVL